MSHYIYMYFYMQLPAAIQRRPAKGLLMNNEHTDINEPSAEEADGTPDEGAPADRRPLGYWLRAVDALSPASSRPRSTARASPDAIGCC